MNIHQYYADEEVVVLGIIDALAGEPAAFISSTGITFPVLRDEDGAVYELYRPAGPSIAPYPLHYVVDRDGIIQYQSDIYDADAERAVIDALL